MLQLLLLRRSIVETGTDDFKLRRSAASRPRRVVHVRLPSKNYLTCAELFFVCRKVSSAKVCELASRSRIELRFEMPAILPECRAASFGIHSRNVLFPSRRIEGSTRGRNPWMNFTYSGFSARLPYMDATENSFFLRVITRAVAWRDATLTRGS